MNLDTPPQPTPSPPLVPYDGLPFQAFPKAPRAAKVQAIVTEKIDGTNACVVVAEDGRVSAQSRKRIIYPGDDNYGFAGWVEEHSEQLRELGPGYHFGEWWGRGIQRGYEQTQRRFSLFNVSRWGEERPECCDVVPLLYQGELDLPFIERIVLGSLMDHGSKAAPGFMQPEGVMVFVTQLNRYIKAPVDPRPKGEVALAN